MTNQLKNKIIKETEKLLKLKSKLDQAIRIRQNLIIRKLKLFEEFENYSERFMKKSKFKNFLREYEILHKKEVNIMKIFRKGFDNALHILQILKHKCSWLGKYRKKVPKNTKNDIKFTLSTVKKLDERLREYEKRMEYEEELLEDLEGNLNEKVDLLKEIIKIFNKEVGEDLVFIIKLKEHNKQMIRIKRYIEEQLSDRRAISTGIKVGGIGGTAILTTQIVRNLVNNRTLDEYGLILLYLALILGVLTLAVGMILDESINEKRMKLLSKFITSNEIKKLEIY